MWEPGRCVLKDATQASWMDSSEGAHKSRAEGEGLVGGEAAIPQEPALPPLFVESAWGDVGGQGWLGDSSQSPSVGTRGSVCVCSRGYSKCPSVTRANNCSFYLW